MSTGKPTKSAPRRPSEPPNHSPGRAPEPAPEPLRRLLGLSVEPRENPGFFREDDANRFKGDEHREECSKQMNERRFHALPPFLF